MAAPRAIEKDRITMSNKKTIKRTAEPVKKMKKEEKKFSFAKSRRKLAGLIPAIVFIVFAIWYFISSRQ
jgi:flagellar biogenesis protein FliO